MRTVNLQYDVQLATQMDEPVAVAGSLHLPDAWTGPIALDLILALHGGGYTRRYWHPPFGEDEYSFARFFTDRGKAVLALDHLGMGESSQPADETKLSRAKLAAANAHALSETLGHLLEGAFGEVKTIAVTGVGHSIGGLLLLTQAAAFGGMDRIAIMGWANHKQADIVDRGRRLPASGYGGASKSAMRPMFYLADVPLAIIEADDACGSLTPVSLLRDAYDPVISHALSAEITVPVLTVHSVRDMTTDAHAEPSYFRASRDVTLHILEGAAHCQNMAATRKSHWARLERWIAAT